ncbi:HDOD domain-containing protein [Undibacterium sp. Jales W-56]|uniref:HDOD domain-containing protein n=1 Tax=Undibacterium sp. Jales W-56 TaxID=2897325 RepID=UPI0021D0F871|nr:HDOD domain-containing protein [Undibacterium sp. Jales W-56]MCU6433521.1 HDOD domain-containing protein [Undibacterium sp. Jales W-56]
MSEANKVSMAELAAKLQQLPALSSIVMELLHSMETDDVDIGSIATKISHDQTLTAKALRLANSSFYGMQYKIKTIQEAITLLGFRSVQTLVTTSAIIGNFTENQSAVFNITSFWRHAIASAICAREIAHFVNASPDKAFTASLLHDIGKLVLATTYREQYAQVLASQKESNTYLFLLERSMLGIDHAAVGNALAAYWQFPEEIQKAIAYHHEIPPDNDSKLAMIVHIADVIAHALDLTKIEEDDVPEINVLAWERLGLSYEACKKIFNNTETQFEEICQILIA